MKKVLFLLLIIANSATSQNVDSLFISANEHYRNGEFEKAIEQYKEIETTKLVSSELFYNLGNTYYKLSRVGNAIYYYEKALKLNPSNSDVRNNLIFAKRLALDNIEELPKTVFQKFNKKYFKKFSYNQWAVVAVLLSFLVAILFLLFYFAHNPFKKKIFFTLSSISLIFFVFSILITYNQFNKKNIEAIVFAEKTEIRNAPTLNSEKVFTLHEGTKVYILDAVGSWKKIKLADGKLGWIIANEIKIIE